MTKKTETAGPKVILQCTCGATKFQGPFPVGEIVRVDGITELEPQEFLYLCRGCNKVQTTDEMSERVIAEA